MKRAARLLVLLAGASCTPAAHGIPDAAGQHIVEPAIERHGKSSSGRTIMERLRERFAGAALLDESEFADLVAERRFRYREVGSDLVVDRPKEVFRKNGQYEQHRPRVILRGTYSITGGVVSIAGADSFLGLSRERIFFRHDNKLLTASADGSGGVFELIPQS